MRAVVVSVMCALVLALAPEPAAAARACGSVNVKFIGSSTSRYPVRVLRGRVTCARARAVLRHFMATGRPARHWFCAPGQAGDAFAATCATVSKKTVRAYNPR